MKANLQFAYLPQVNMQKKNSVPRGYFIWAEHGDSNDPRKEIPFGMAKGHTGGQEGIILKQDGVFHLYTYE